MKAIISDIDVLSHLQLLSLEAYLQKTGWQERNRIPNKVSIWTRASTSEDNLKIQLPVDQDFDDYSLRISEIINILENAENRSQLDIVGDLITNSPNTTIQGVVTHIATPNADNLSGQITLLGVVIDKLRSIHIELADHDYILAVKAYQERLPVECKGDLIKENNVFILKNPHPFNLIHS
ncbi:hypothetical protein RIVM261_029890 [Rivularia sp. IAM M-261]|nr:hypothetical protein RIVM261_029890 [Rivularia sp. IAM M-261]